MSNILTIIPETLAQLSSKQSEIAGLLKNATVTPQGISGRVDMTHGSFTSKFNDALREVETSRTSTGNGVESVSGALASNLLKAATAYLNTDQGLGGIIDKIIPR